MKVFTLNAFAKTDDGGNPAGVVFDADSLTEQQMKDIAKKVGYSETAFVMGSKRADFKVRFFTPADEVDLCGHATIATYNLMLIKGMIKEGNYTQETKAGLLKLDVRKDIVFMQQKLPEFLELPSQKKIADSLNIKTDYFADLPIQIVSTGLKDIFIPIMDREMLFSIMPDFKEVSMISKQYDVIGYHMFTLDTKASAHCRNLAPLYGIDEESATGTSNGALACYLWKYHEKKTEFIFEQGYSMKKPSEIIVNLKLRDNSIAEVWVGGTAKGIKKIEL
jgi:PhzF family phenazine biosynthesis protein